MNGMKSQAEGDIAGMKSEADEVMDGMKSQVKLSLAPRVGQRRLRLT